ncbi:DEAD/DEAH box helicase [Candidatus Lokiarchaeum ossiferum]|uniref:DEAD/DEAH box helicase n=1 Tax=Candidatus Lokiarchaeum ossiferum TaxID=2951803 RepID=UPI00352DBC6E
MSNQTAFHNLGLNAILQRAIRESGYLKPTPIQSQTIPPLLEGRDLVGCAQTGTGKTAAFALPILQLLAIKMQEKSSPKSKLNSHSKKNIRVLVLSPTRELAIQIGDSFSKYGRFNKKITNTVIFGGVKQNKQVKTLKSGVDILVATPGRLLDLIGQDIISLHHIEILVFDEADRMLDMGFIHDVRKIMKNISGVHQTMLFSATMPKQIVQLAKDFLQNPVKVSVTPNQPTVEKIDQTVHFVPKSEKQALLLSIVTNPKVIRALVFSRTKHGANKIVKKLIQAGVGAEPIHGNKSQNARQKALKNFRDGTTRILVATDVAARGIDVENISHVIQFDLPDVSETYVHRIGRTARAGAGGIAIAFCASDERPLLRDIEKLIRMKIPDATNSRPRSKQKLNTLPQKNQSILTNSKKRVNQSHQKNQLKSVKPPFKCPQCSRLFSSKAGVSQHIKAKHNPLS